MNDDFDALRRRRNARIGIISVVVVIALITGSLTWLVVWALRDDEPAPSRQVTSVEAYRDGWESAMRKAGVEGEFPGGRVDLEQVTSIGRQPFSATFAPAEVEALLAVYRFRPEAFSGRAELEQVDLEFPDAGQAELEARATLSGRSYAARVSAPVSFMDGRIVVDGREADLSVEGFSVGGTQRQQAIEAMNQYLNSLLQAAPGLTVENAEIVPGGVRVTGTAPVSIQHPDPLPSGGATALALHASDI